MKLNQVVIAILTRDTDAALQIAVNDFLRDSGEATLLSMHYAVATDVFSVMIVYTN